MNPSTVGLVSGVNYSREKIISIIQRKLVIDTTRILWNIKDSVNQLKSLNKAATINNLVVLVRFADDTAFSKTTSQLDALFNDENNPSLKHYFREVSYNQLEVNSVYVNSLQGNVFSFQDSFPKSYYQPRTVNNPNGCVEERFCNLNGYCQYEESDVGIFRIDELMNRISEYINLAFDTAYNYDIDNDNTFDAITLIVSDAVVSGREMLWAHMHTIRKNSLKNKIFIDSLKVKNFILLNNVNST